MSTYYEYDKAIFKSQDPNPHESNCLYFKINSLPPELIVTVFKNLPLEDVESCCQTCQSWKLLCSRYILLPLLLRLSENHSEIREVFESQNLLQDCQDQDLILLTYQRLKYFSSKILIYNGQTEEIIDMSQEQKNSKYQVYNPIPIQATRGIFGTLVQGQPFMCGGIDYETRRHHVLQTFYHVGNDDSGLGTMLCQRFYGSCTELNSKSVWIVGGKTRNNTRWKDTHLETTEIIIKSSNDTLKHIQGPNLPFTISHHAMIKYDDHRIFIIGGDQDGVISNQTWIVDPLDDFKITRGPTMIEKRSGFSCGSIILNGKYVILAAGGNGERLGTTLKSVEILDPTSTKGWMKGPSLPFKLSDASCVTSPAGIYLIGGFNGTKAKSSDAILELDSRCMEWTQKYQTLKFIANGIGTIAFSIPGEYIFQM